MTNNNKKTFVTWILITIILVFSTTIFVSIVISKECKHDTANYGCDSQRKDVFGSMKWACSKKTWVVALGKCTSSTGDGECSNDEACDGCKCIVDGTAIDGQPCFCRLSP